MVDKTIIVFHQRTKSYTVPDFSEDTVLVEQTQGTDEDATQIPSQDMKIILKKLSFRMNNMKLMATIELKPVISLRNSNYLKNFKYLWKLWKLLEVEAGIVSGCNEQTPLQSNTNGNALTSISVINML